MLNFLNNGGLEWILGVIYLGGILIQAKIEDRRVRQAQVKKPEKWHW